MLRGRTDGHRRSAGELDQFARSTSQGSSNRKTADAFAANVLPIVRQIQAAGALRAIAAALNDRGVRTTRGGAWHDSTVRNLLARAG